MGARKLYQTLPCTCKYYQCVALFSEMGDSNMVNEYEVLLATCNGQHYIEEQLDSIAAQSVPP